MPTRTATYRNPAMLTAVVLMLALPAHAAAKAPGALYYHVDYLGSIVAVSGNAATVRARLAWSAYGTPRVTSSEPGAAQPARFTGKQWAKSTGLTYFGARYHAPALGRFLGPDAARQTSSPYAYVGAAPLEWIDPDGNMYGAPGREALRVAAARRGLEYESIRDPITRLEVAREAREYAYQRRLSLAARIGELQAHQPAVERIAQEYRDHRIYKKGLRKYSKVHDRLSDYLRAWMFELDRWDEIGALVDSEWLERRIRNLYLVKSRADWMLASGRHGWSFEKVRFAIRKYKMPIPARKMRDILGSCIDECRTLTRVNGTPRGFLGPVVRGPEARNALQHRIVSPIVDNMHRVNMLPDLEEEYWQWSPESFDGKRDYLRDYTRQALIDARNEVRSEDRWLRYLNPAFFE